MKSITIFGILAFVACGPGSLVEAADGRFALPRTPDAVTTTAIEFRPVPVMIQEISERVGYPAYWERDGKSLVVEVKWRNSGEHSIWVVGDSADGVFWRVERRSDHTDEWRLVAEILASQTDLHEVAPGAVHEFRARVGRWVLGQEIRVVFDYFEQPRIVERGRMRAASSAHRVFLPLTRSGADR